MVAFGRMVEGRALVEVDLGSVKGDVPLVLVVGSMVTVPLGSIPLSALAQDPARAVPDFLEDVVRTMRGLDGPEVAA